MAYDLLQAQSDIATLRGQIAHLLSNVELINATVDGMLTVNGTLLDSVVPVDFVLAHTAGTTANGDTYGYGYTGPAQNFVPSSSPRTLETWHNVTPPSGWSGTNRYKNLSERNMIMIDFNLTHAGASGNITVMTLPALYRPASAHVEPLAITNNSAPLNQNQRFTVNTDGTVTTFSLAASTTTIAATIICPLD